MSVDFSMLRTEIVIAGGRTLYAYEFEEAPSDEEVPPVEPSRDSEDDG